MSNSKLNTDAFDLCIIGAGLAGLNALFVAAQYLSKTDRVVIVDRNNSCGGMWNETYDYVRLHQPHQMFTVGDMPWIWDRPADFLATGGQVQAHLSWCLDQLRSTLDLTELFGFDCVDIEEFPTPDGPRSRIRCRSLDNTNEVRVIEAKQTISAPGWDIPVVKPLTLSSTDVVSTTPNLLTKDDTNQTVPVVLVGGGKTAMDTALTLLQRFPDREITLINGQGTVFANRDKLFPRGARRWWQGAMVSAISSDLNMRFDGKNTEEVFKYFRETYGISPDGGGERYFFSMMSGDEADQIRNGLHEIVNGYLEDIVASEGEPKLVMRDGTVRPVRSGSLVVNCTGHLLQDTPPYVPYISPLGSVLTITTRSSAYPLTGTSAYFLAHVFFLGKLSKLPLYELDIDSVMKADPKLFFLTSMTHAFYNMLVIMDNVPLDVFGRCGLDLNRWFPMPRRLVSLVRLKLNHRRYLDHCRKSLDTVRRETGVRCGPLDFK